MTSVRFASGRGNLLLTNSKDSTLKVGGGFNVSYYNRIAISWNQTTSMVWAVGGIECSMVTMMLRMRKC